MGDAIAANATDEQIVTFAAAQDRIVLTQDLDFSAIVALSGQGRPSVVSLRLSSSRVEHVNDVLERELPSIEADLMRGALVSIEDDRARTRLIPIE